MNKVMSLIFGVAIGGGIGYLIGKKVEADKAEEVIREEVASVKEAFRRRRTKAATRKEDEKPAKESPEEKERIMKNYRETVEEEKYAPKETPEEEEIRKMAEKLKPRSIDPVDLGEKEEYGDTIEFVLYADGVLTGSDNKPMGDDEIEDYVGADFEKHIGEFEEDMGYFVNDRLRSYFAITRESITYAEYVDKHPYLRK